MDTFNTPTPPKKIIPDTFLTNQTIQVCLYPRIIMKIAIADMEFIKVSKILENQ